MTTTLFEDFVNAELPLRIGTVEAGVPTAGKLPVYKGVGLLTEAKTLAEAGIATTEYADGLVVGLWDDRGAYTVNAAGNINYPSSAGSGVAGALMKGDIFTVAGAVAGVSTISNIAVNNGDTVRALVDNPSDTDNAHWAIAENNIGYVPENQTNKDTDGTLSSNSDAKYPSQKAVKTYADTKQPLLVSGTNIKTINGTSVLGSGDLTTASIPEVRSASFTAVTGRAYTLGSPSSTLSIQFPVGTTDGEEIIIHMNRSALTQGVYVVPPAGQHVAYVGAGTYQLISGFCDHILRFEFVLSALVWELKAIIPAGSITDVVAFCSSVNILSRLKFNLPTANGVYQWYTPAKNINFGELANVATTNSNSLSGTRTRILGGSSNTVDGEDNIAVNCTGVIFGSSANVASTLNCVINVRNAFNSAGLWPFPQGTIVLGSSLITNAISHCGALGGITCAYAEKIPASGTNNVTIDGSTTASAGNCIKAVAGTTAHGAATHEVEFIVGVGYLNFDVLQIVRTVYGKRKVFAHRGESGGITSTVITQDTDQTEGVAATGSITLGVTVDTTNNRIIPTVTATSGSNQTYFSVSARITSHYNRK